MKRFTTSLYAAAGILLLAFVLNAVGPKRVMAALGYTPVRDVDNPARQPYQMTIASIGGGAAAFTVPAGKRLVVTGVSAVTTSSAAQDVELNSAVNSPYAMTFRVPFSVSVNGLHYATLTGSDIWQAGPGPQDTLYIAPLGTTTFSCLITVSGYLVDVP